VSTLYWLKFARKTKFFKQPEYANVEALLEAEADQPDEDFRQIANVVPPILAGVGLLVAVAGIFFTHSLTFLFAILGFGTLATVLWFIFDRLDKKIPRSRARLTKHSKEVLGRVCGFTNIIGIEPALSPAVGQILDEAAGIYLKHRSGDPGSFAESRQRAFTALEEGMAKLMELGTQPTVRAQELELQRGWAYPMLQEMRSLDKALDEHQRNSLANPLQADDPLAQLRSARMELQGIDTAIDELRQQS